MRSTDNFSITILVLFGVLALLGWIAQRQRAIAKAEAARIQRDDRILEKIIQVDAEREIKKLISPY